MHLDMQSASRPFDAPSCAPPLAMQGEAGNEIESDDDDCLPLPDTVSGLKKRSGADDDGLNWTYSPKIECVKEGKTKCFIRTPQFTETTERQHALHLVREFEIVPDKQSSSNIPQALATSRSSPGLMREESLRKSVPDPAKLRKCTLPPVQIPSKARGEKTRSRYTLYRATCPKQRDTYRRNAELCREDDAAAKVQTPLSSDRSTASERARRILRDLKVDILDRRSSSNMKKHVVIGSSSSLPSLKDMLQ
jgi:hypothetical protein